MQGIPMFTGPLPPTGDHWCTPCAMLWKGQAMALESVAVQIKAALAEVGTVTWIDLTEPARKARMETPAIAIAYGTYVPLQQNFPVGCWLCWSHLMALTMTGGLIPASALEMPPPGGIPRIGGGRRTG